MLEKERRTATQLAYEAGSLALSRASRPLGIRDKGGDEGPVTEVDRMLDRFLREELQRRFPEDLVISEESPPPEPDPTARVWYVDPIDGTTELIKGNGEWSILIGLTEHQRPVLGVVFRPPTGELYHAAVGEGAFRRSDPERRDSKLHVNDVSDPESAVLVQSRSHPSTKVEKVARTLGIRKRFRLGSFGCKLAKIAEGAADLYLNFSGKCHLWDVCAPEVILREAGGDVRTIGNHSMPYGGRETIVPWPLACGAKPLIPAVVQVLEEQDLLSE